MHCGALRSVFADVVRACDDLRIGASTQGQLPESTGFPPAMVQPGVVGETGHTPLWEPRFANWTQAAIDAHLNTRQTDFDQVLNLVQQGLITGFPAGTPFGADGFIVTCPVVSREVPRS